MNSFQKLQELLVEVHDEYEALKYRAGQFDEIRATLVVNCQPHRTLGKLDITYDHSRSVNTNLFSILTKLTGVTLMESKESV